MTDVAAKISAFKQDLRRLSVQTIVQKHITFGSCHVLGDDRYFELKTQIAKHFELHPSEVVVVGSGKLGFSIVAGKRYRLFGDTSDIDVALVSPRLFDSYWMEVFEFKADRNFWPRESEFNSYLLKGWIRPDLLPPARRFLAAKGWWEFFRKLVKTLGAECNIAAGLYRNWPFLERYQSICVDQCRADLADK